MCKIALLIKELPGGATALSRIRRVTGQSFAEMQRRIQSGAAVVEYVLFMNDHDEVAERLRELLVLLPQVGADFRIFESDGAAAGLDVPSIGAELDVDALEHILASHEEERERLRQLDELGHR